MDKILTHIVSHCLYITLNYPEKHNCIGKAMLQTLGQTLLEAEHNAAVKVIVMQGAGEKAFSSGGDLKEFNALNEAAIIDWIKLGNTVFNQLENSSKPTIAAIRGYAFGGGLELVLACDFRIATEAAVFQHPELAHGWIPGWGGMTRLKRLIGEASAKKIILLGERMHAAEALAMGLVTKVVANDLLEEEVKTISEQLATLHPFAFSIAKQALQDNNRTTYGTDLMSDILATLYTRGERN